MLELTPKEFKMAQQEARLAKKRRIKQDWIRKHKMDPYLDYEIVYKDDEEIHEHKRMQFSFLN